MHSRTLEGNAMAGKSGDELGREMMAAVRDFFSRSTAPILDQISALVARFDSLPAPVNGKDGERGPAGESIKGDAGERGPAGDTGSKGDTGERGSDGERGPAGESGRDADPVLIARMVADAIAEIPPAKDGTNGRDGIDADPVAVESLIRQYVKLAVAEIPIPRDGTPGERGERGSDGRSGTDGREGIDGINGVNGKDGRDALLVDEFAAELQDDGRTIAFHLSSGGKEFRSQIRLDVPLDKGVWREGEYQKADGVTWDGSFWIAQRATTDKPGTSDHFRLATKRGRDGRDGKPDAKPAREPVRIR